jgi:hypothetical protein
MVVQLEAILSNTVQVVDNEVSGQPQLQDLARFTEALPQVVVAELEYAVGATGFEIQDFLLAALGRAIAKAFGSGSVIIAKLTAAKPIRLCCATERELAADHLLEHVRAALDAGRCTGSGVDLVFTHLPLAQNMVFVSVEAADGAALHVLTYHGDELLEVEWVYDSRRLFDATIEDLSKQFTLALVELTLEATRRRASPDDVGCMQVGYIQRVS